MLCLRTTTRTTSTLKENIARVGRFRPKARRHSSRFQEPSPANFDTPVGGHSRANELANCGSQFDFYGSLWLFANH